MTIFGDYSSEMSLEELLEDHGVAAFATSARAASTRLPEPSSALAYLLTNGVSPKAEPALETTKQSKWRNSLMNIKAYVAGLGVAAKVMLGAGVAAAATTGAGMAGVLPDSVQHVVARTVEGVTPFVVPDPRPDHGSVGTSEHPTGSGHDEHSGSAVTPTTVASGPTAAAPVGGHEGHGATEPTTSTTIAHEPSQEIHHETTPTTTVVTPTTEVVTPTTTPTADHNNPESIALICHAAHEPNRVICSWTASTNPDHRRYALLRTNDHTSEGRVVFQTETHLEFTDTAVTAGVTYTYRVVSLRADGSTESHSNGVSVLVA